MASPLVWLSTGSRPVEVGVLTNAIVASIISHRLDQSAPEQPADGARLLHDNVRGSGHLPGGDDIAEPSNTGPPTRIAGFAGACLAPLRHH